MNAQKLSYGITEFTNSGFGKLPLEFHSFESAQTWVTDQKVNAKNSKDVERVDYDIIPYTINEDGSSTPVIACH